MAKKIKLAGTFEARRCRMLVRSQCLVGLATCLESLGLQPKLDGRKDRQTVVVFMLPSWEGSGEEFAILDREVDRFEVKYVFLPERARLIRPLFPVAGTGKLAFGFKALKAQVAVEPRNLDALCSYCEGLGLIPMPYVVDGGHVLLRVSLPVNPDCPDASALFTQEILRLHGNIRTRRIVDLICPPVSQVPTA